MTKQVWPVKKISKYNLFPFTCFTIFYFQYNEVWSENDCTECTCTDKGHVCTKSCAITTCPEVMYYLFMTIGVTLTLLLNFDGLLGLTYIKNNQNFHFFSICNKGGCWTRHFDNLTSATWQLISVVAQFFIKTSATCHCNQCKRCFD